MKSKEELAIELSELPALFGEWWHYKIAFPDGFLTETELSEFNDLRALEDKISSASMQAGDAVPRPQIIYDEKYQAILEEEASLSEALRKLDDIENALQDMNGSIFSHRDSMRGLWHLAISETRNRLTVVRDQKERLERGNSKVTKLRRAANITYRQAVDSAQRAKRAELETLYSEKLWRLGQLRQVIIDRRQERMTPIVAQIDQILAECMERREK